MKYSQIDGIDKPVSRLLQGSIMLSQDDRDGNFRLLDACFENGFNAFDSAHSYGGGFTDSELGAWIASRGIRDEVVILAKGAHPEKGIADRVRPEYIRSDLEESLERLQTDTVELYLLHRDSRDYPVGEIVDVRMRRKPRERSVCTAARIGWETVSKKPTTTPSPMAGRHSAL